MNLFLEEIGTTPNSTASQLFVDGKPFCFVVEDGYRDRKVPGETRISPGRYQIVKATSGKFFEDYRKRFGHKFALLLLHVPLFTAIMVHIGCFVKDTRGCLLVNTFIGIGPDGSYCGKDSTVVYKLLYALIEKAFERGEEVWIEIQRREIIDENALRKFKNLK